MMKVLLIGLKEESKWTSCRSIKQNLLSTYQALYQSQSELFEILNSENLDDDIQRLATLIKLQSFAKIIFIDHRPNPAKILNLIVDNITQTKLPPIVIHLYGDFTYFAKDFLNLNLHFIGHQISFLAASTAQKKLVNFFLTDANCMHFPFSIDEKFYHFNSTYRERFRKSHQLSGNEKVILYAGRLSLQKNIEAIIKDFELHKKSSPSNDQLFLAGHFDDFGARFMGVRCLEGYYFNKITKLIQGSPFKKDIKFLGNLNAEQLRDAYCGADLYINYSLHHDEDFGISPLEALACQLPLLLTPWGGLNDFPANFCALKLDQLGYHISLGGIKACASLSRTESQYQKPNGDLLVNPQSNIFLGFNHNLEKFIKNFSTEGNFLTKPNLNSTPDLDNLYFQIYSHYSILSDFNQPEYTVNWIFDHIENSKYESGFNKIDKARDLYEDLLPYSTSYFSPIPGDFFNNGQPGIIKAESILVRNGLLGIDQHLKQHLPTSQKYFYPEEVQSHFEEIHYLYRVQSFVKKTRLDEIIISPCFLNNFDAEKLKTELLYLKSFINENQISKIWILVTDNPLFTDSYKKVMIDLEANHFNYEVLNWISFRTISDLSNIYFYEILDPNLILSTFSSFSAQSRGATICSRDKDVDLSKWKPISNYPLSPFHQLKTYERIK